jgi:hypothetical protein
MVRSSRNNELFRSFTPAVSPSALKVIRSTVRDLNIRQRTQRSLDDIGRMLNPLLQGWIGYYGRYNRAALETMLRHVVRIQPALFEHWRIGMIGAFARWERCEARVSRTVLREAGGEIPPTHSPAVRAVLRRAFALEPARAGLASLKQMLDRLFRVAAEALSHYKGPSYEGDKSDRASIL